MNDIQFWGGTHFVFSFETAEVSETSTLHHLATRRLLTNSIHSSQDSMHLPHFSTKMNLLNFSSNPCFHLCSEILLCWGDFSFLIKDLFNISYNSFPNWTKAKKWFLIFLGSLSSQSLSGSVFQNQSFTNLTTFGNKNVYNSFKTAFK